MSTHLQIPTGLTVSGGSPRTRVPRSPTHTFNVRHKPFQIQPMMLAPVKAGETLQNMLWQSRVVTDPIRNPLIGWHLEYYFFYVKLRDLASREDFEEMLLDMTKDMSGLEDSTANPQHYHYAGINYSKLCLDRVVEEFFRDEGETILQGAIDGLPAAQVKNRGWLDSVYNDANIPSDDIASGDLPLDFADMEGKYNTWLFMRNQAVTEMSFEDYLGTFGVRSSGKEDPHKPELIRMSKQWSYPSNTIDPSTGAPSSAVSWSVTERADKKRFFNEPGFIFGVTLARPKIYMGNQREHGSHMLDNALSWLPAQMRENVHSSLKKFDAGTGVLGNVHTANDYWVDVRDLFVHGDQFVNFDLTETDAGLMALPTNANNTQFYPTEAMADGLFVDEDDGEYTATRLLIRQDGVVNPYILGTEQDYT